MAAQINPYQDWQAKSRVARPEDLLPDGSKAPRLCPVYVTFKSPSAERIDAFTALAADPDALGNQSQYWLLDDVARDCLARLQGAIGTADDARFASFYIYRFERHAYKNTRYFKVRKVGVALPGGLFSQLQRQVTHATIAAKTVNYSQSTDTVLTAVIDDFFGIANSQFRQAQTESRVERFWVQNTPDTTEATTGDVSFGRRFSKAEINTILAANLTNGRVDEAAFLRALYAEGSVPQNQSPAFVPFSSANSAAQYAPDLRPANFRVSHGTHMLDLAAGLPMEEASADRPILAVQLPPLATIDTSGARLEHSILSAVQRVLIWADEALGAPAPCVINLSYANAAGSKDGFGFFEREVARLVTARNATGGKTQIVIAAGNGYRRRSHAQAKLSSTGQASFAWNLLPADISSNFLEIWTDKRAEYEITIKSPKGKSWTIEVPMRSKVQNLKEGGVLIGRAYRQKTKAQDGITIALARTLNYDRPADQATPGAYEMTLTATGTEGFTFSAEVQRDDTPSNYPLQGYQSYLSDEGSWAVDPETTHGNDSDGGIITREGTLSAYATGSPSTGLNDPVVVVGAALDRDFFPEVTPRKAALYSASGPTLGRAEPSVSAVSDETRTHWGRLATGTFSGSTATLAGTSVAAAIVTRELVNRLSGARPRKTTPNTIDPARLGSQVFAFEQSASRPARRIRG